MRRWVRGVLQRALASVDGLKARLLSIRSGDPLARRFASFGAGSAIAAPWIALDNPSAVAIGERVRIRSQVCLEVLAEPGDVKLRIGDGVLVGHYVRFVAMNGIEIEEDCGIGHGSTLTDTMHDWRQVLEGEPAEHAPLRTGPSLRIRRGAWIGNNCVIVGGVEIGERAIIAPNSVVTRDVPARTMVSGNPARRVPVTE